MESESQVVWSEEAIDDVGDILDYLSSNASVAVAEKTYEEIEKAKALIQRHPKSSPERRRARVKFVISVPYIIVYDYNEEENVVRILRVLHKSRKHPYR